MDVRRTLRSLVPLLGAPLFGCAHATSDAPTLDPMQYVESAEASPAPTHGLSIGAVGPSRALIWSRTDRDSIMHVRLRSGTEEHLADERVSAAHDYAVSVPIEGLSPDTAYDVEVWFDHADRRRRTTRVVVDGHFRTAPPEDRPAPVRLAFGGDVAGQNVCRDRYEGLPMYDVLADQRLDLFIGLGDMIYADNPCRSTGRYGNRQVAGPTDDAESVEDYWARWRYVRADPAQRRLLASTVAFTTWDDHELANDFDPTTDERRRTPRLDPARRAFFDWNAIEPTGSTHTDVHRRFRWGRHLEVFVLDERQHRDPDRRTDDADRPKTMLGAAQRRWLESALAESNATWKLVVSSVTLAVPSGSLRRRDGWADAATPRGFEHELRGVLEAARQAGVQGLVVVSADVHFGAVFRHTPFAESPSFSFLELVSGPMNARPFARLDYDRSFGSERLFYFGPLREDDVQSYAEARAFLNACTLEIDADGRLSYTFLNSYGRVVHRGSVPANDPAAIAAIPVLAPGAGSAVASAVSP